MNNTTTLRNAQIQALLSTIASTDANESCLNFIIDKLNEIEKTRFGTTLLRKMINPSDDSFCVEEIEVQQLLGYTNKATFIRFMKKHLERKEYTVVKSGEKKMGRPVEQYCLTIDGMRKLCLLADTPEGEVARLYYLKLEDLVISFCTQRLVEQQEALKHKDEIIQQLKGRKMVDQELGESVYVFQDASQVIRIGKTAWMKQRNMPYEMHNPNGNMEYAVHCLNGLTLERVSHHILNQFHAKDRNSWYECSSTLAHEVINTGQIFLDSLVGYADHLEDFKMSERMTALMKEYHDFYDSLAGKKAETTTTEHPRHIDDVRTLTKPKERPTAQSLFGGAATVTMNVTNAAIDTSEISFQNLVQDTNHPDDLDKFVTDLFVIDDKLSVTNGQVTNVYKFWCNSTSKAKRDKMLEYMKERFVEKRGEYDSVIKGRKTMFLGLKLRPIVWKLPDEPQEFDRFVADTFIVDCSARVRKTRVDDLYTVWTNSRAETRSELTASKRKLKLLEEYLSNHFIYDVIWLGSEQGQQLGYLGIGVPNELVGVGLHPVKGTRMGSKRIFLKSVETGEIVKMFDTQSEAANYLGVAQSAVTVAKKRKRPICDRQYVILDVDDLTEEEKSMITAYNDAALLATASSSSSNNM